MVAPPVIQDPNCLLIGLPRPSGYVNFDVKIWSDRVSLFLKQYFANTPFKSPESIFRNINHWGILIVGMHKNKCLNLRSVTTEIKEKKVISV